MKGLIKEGEETVQAEEKGALRDLGIIAAAQRVEHYEISAYGTARTLAEQLNIGEASELLHETEDEEANADATLTTIAMSLYKTFNGDSYDSEAVLAGASAVRAEHSGQVRKQALRGARSA
jgi:ferritin-like metal-binding protein YciE